MRQVVHVRSTHDDARCLCPRSAAAAHPLFVVFTMRGPLIRVLAARPMTRKERVIYAHAEAQHEEGESPV